MEVIWKSKSNLSATRFTLAEAYNDHYAVDIFPGYSVYIFNCLYFHPLIVEGFKSLKAAKEFVSNWEDVDIDWKNITLSDHITAHFQKKAING